VRWQTLITVFDIAPMSRFLSFFVLLSLLLAAALLPARSVGAGSGPSISFSTYLRGYQTSIGKSIAIDARGNVVVSGTRDDGDHHPGSFVVKLDASGQAILWRDEFDATIAALATDPQGNIYLAGSIGDGYWPAVNALQPSPGSPTSAVVAKLDPNGKILYGTYLGGSGVDQATGIAVDNRGNAVVTGTDQGPFPQFAGLPRGGGNRAAGVAFVTKLNPTGTHAVYSTTVGGRLAASGLDVVTNASGSAAFVLVKTSAGDSAFPTTRLTKGFSSAQAGTAVLKLWQGKRTVQLVYSIRMSDKCVSCGSIALDRAGEVYAALGKTLVKVNPGGTALDWRRHPMLPGNVPGDARSVSVDWQGQPTVVGSVVAKQLMSLLPLSGVGNTADGAYVGRFDRVGRPLFRTFIPHSWAYGVAVGGKGNAVITGEAKDDGFPTFHDIGHEIPIPACQQPGSTANTDVQCPTAFVTKLVG
jgi:hypothetical protein